MGRAWGDPGASEGASEDGREAGTAGAAEQVGGQRPQRAASARTAPRASSREAVLSGTIYSSVAAPRARA